MSSKDPEGERDKSSKSWEADKMLDVYIHDYFVKRKLHATAKAFQAEGEVPKEPLAIDTTGGFLLEWWSVFWDIFISRTDKMHSEAATSYVETQLIKAREHQQRQEYHELQDERMQQLLSSKDFLPQQLRQQMMKQKKPRRDGSLLLSNALEGLVGREAVTMQNPDISSFLATKVLEGRRKLPMQGGIFVDAVIKKSYGGDVSHLLNPNQLSVLSSGSGSQLPRQNLNKRSRKNVENFQRDIEKDKRSVMQNRAAFFEPSSIRTSGSDQGVSNFTLNGWPLALGSAHHRQHKLLVPSPPLVPSSPAINQLELQQQYLLQGQQNLASPSNSDLDWKRFEMLLAYQNMCLGIDGHTNSTNNIVPHVRPPQVPSSMLSYGNYGMLMEHQQNNNQQQQEYMQDSSISQHLQKSNNVLQHQDKFASSCTMTEVSMANVFQENHQASRDLLEQRSKQPASSLGPARSAHAANTVGLPPRSPLSSTHAASESSSQHDGIFPKSVSPCGHNVTVCLLAAKNQLGDMDNIVAEGSSLDNVDSHLLHHDPDVQNQVPDISRGFSLTEIQHLSASTSKVECCHFSFDGELLAIGGYDGKVSLWCMETFKLMSTLGEHSECVNDLRFSLSLPRLATCSDDGTVRIWDAYKPGHPQRMLMGHNSSVLSLDFHPRKDDLICSCDGDQEIRYWSIKKGCCAGIIKVGASHIRFQPPAGKFLAAAVKNFVWILDVDMQTCRQKLQGHDSSVHCICWDSTGQYLASVSDSMIKVWEISSNCVVGSSWELKSTGTKFHTSVFHHTCPFLVIGCDETLELWDMVQNRRITIQAHNELVSALAASRSRGLVASASHDMHVKVWK